MDQDFSNKIGLVTGAAQGIGYACAKLFRARGATVILTDIQAGAVEAAAKSLGGNCIGLGHDVSDEESWRRVLDCVSSAYGKLDVLVNAAGIGHASTIADIDVNDWRKVQAINTESVYLGCHFAVEAMRERGGAIVNVSSAAAHRPPVNNLAYSVSKSGIGIITRHTAVHCGEAGYKIRCNAVLPGPIRTPMGEYVMQGFVDRGLVANRTEAERMYAGRSVLGRIAAPEEVAEAVAFLASDKASFITGVELPVDGGMCAR